MKMRKIRKIKYDRMPNWRILRLRDQIAVVVKALIEGRAK